EQPTLKPTMQNSRKQTAAHCAAENKHWYIVNILIKDPRIDTSIMDEDRRTIRELIDRSNEKYRKKVFGRVTLDIHINRMVSELQKTVDNKLIFTITRRDINDAIEKIKKNITQIAKDKGQSSKLSKSATIPRYATDEFIRQMLLLRLFENNTKNEPVNKP